MQTLQPSILTGKSPTLHSEPELTQPVALCDAQGRLIPASVGWSRQPLHTCNLRGHWPRKKKWNYWCITNQRFLFSITLSHIDYMGLTFAYFLDFETRRYIEQTVMVPLGQGFKLGETVNAEAVFEHKALSASFQEAGDTTTIRVSSPNFGGASLAADLQIQHPLGHETLNVVIPWKRDRFQFTSKQNCLPTSGTIRLDGESFHFQPDSAFACLDFGRGVWPYACFWNWSSCSGVYQGRSIGLNLGGGWTDGTGMTENALCIDGRVSKIGEALIFTYDPANFMAPWTIKTAGSQRVDVRFIPFFERVAKSDLLILRSEVHQMIGRLAGTVITDIGESVSFENLVGWAEEHRARW